MKSTPPGFPRWYPGWFLHVERWFWPLFYGVQHPVMTYQNLKKWAERPAVGQQVYDCRGKLVTVVGFGKTEDDLIFDDGTSTSWMSCCSWHQE